MIHDVWANVSASQQYPAMSWNLFDTVKLVWHHPVKIKVWVNRVFGRQTNTVVPCLTLSFPCWGFCRLLTVCLCIIIEFPPLSRHNREEEASLRKWEWRIHERGHWRNSEPPSRRHNINSSELKEQVSFLSIQPLFNRVDRSEIRVSFARATGPRG